MAAMSRFNRFWRSNAISFASELKLYNSLVTAFFVLAERHVPCLLTLRKGSRLLRPSARGNFSASSARGTKPTTGCGAKSLPCGSTGISSGSYQETETRMIRECHTTRQPLQHHPLGHLGRVVGRRDGGGLARQRKCWKDNVKEWTSASMPELLTMASHAKC